MKLLISALGLVLNCMPAFAAGSEFLISMVDGQPLVIVQALPDENSKNGDTIVTVENRSPRAVKDFWLVLAGTSCVSKPIWPGIRYSDKSKSNPHNIEPGGRAEIRLDKKLVREIESVAEKTCNKKLPSELAIDGIEFVDGSSWTLSEAIKRGDLPHVIK